ncbi:palmitoyltransferase ZDHHC3-like [Choloepus didactylus]|uniref:palmitoyltransferase ZDHHC3-like n=1 Tax=Choloepus didactylus TaxID=27675 RepID=UPI00189F6CAF|nr:palmitoyltransferase ZDHHC3-like [Choloepus didactylus]
MLGTATSATASQGTRRGTGSSTSPTQPLLRHSRVCGFTCGAEGTKLRTPRGAHNRKVMSGGCGAGQRCQRATLPEGEASCCAEAPKAPLSEFTNPVSGHILERREALASFPRGEGGGRRRSRGGSQPPGRPPGPWPAARGSEMPEGPDDARAGPGAQMPGAHARVRAAHRRPAWVPAGAPRRRVWFVCDPLGIACAAGTWLLVLYATGVLLEDLLIPSEDAAYGVANGALFHLLAFLGLASHARTMLSDPGSVPVGYAPPPGPAPAASWCARCSSARPARAHHCRVCRRCVRKMDHHCPLVNNCVGEDNQKYFVLFTLYIALASLHALLLLGIPVLRSYARGEWDAHSSFSPRLSVLVLFLVALKGLLFASVMFWTQMYAICTDRTRLEQLQRERGRGRRSTGWMNLKAVCGPSFSLAWLSPFASPAPQNAAQQSDLHWGPTSLQLPSGLSHSPSWKMGTDTG